MAGDSVHFQITSYKDFTMIRPTIRAFLQQYLHGNDCFRTEIALNEAINNALKFGPGTVRNPVCIDLEEDGSELSIRVKDQGPGFSAASLSAVIEADPIERLENTLLEEHGKGILVMRAAVDGVIYSHDGSEVVLVKKIK